MTLNNILNLWPVLYGAGLYFKGGNMGAFIGCIIIIFFLSVFVLLGEHTCIGRQIINKGVDKLTNGKDCKRNLSQYKRK